MPEWMSLEELTNLTHQKDYDALINLIYAVGALAEIDVSPIIAKLD